MAIIPDGTKFLGVDSSLIDLREKKGTINNNKTEYYDIADIVNMHGNEVEYSVSGGTTGTQPVFDGDPLFTASYVKIGKLVNFQIQVDMDNITSFGTGQYYLTLPYKSKHSHMLRCGCLHDQSTGREYHISGHVNADSDQILLYTSDTQGNNLYDFPFTSTEPITLSELDNLHLSASYITV